MNPMKCRCAWYYRCEAWQKKNQELCPLFMIILLIISIYRKFMSQTPSTMFESSKWNLQHMQYLCIVNVHDILLWNSPKGFQSFFDNFKRIYREKKVWSWTSVTVCKSSRWNWLYVIPMTCLYITLTGSSNFAWSPGCFVWFILLLLMWTWANISQGEPIWPFSTTWTACSIN